MNVNLQRFTRTWPNLMAGIVEGEEGGVEEVEGEDELGKKSIKINLML